MPVLSGASSLALLWRSGALAAELSERLAKGPVRFRVLVQLAGAGDEVADATAVWPETREEVEFGTITLTERVDELAPEVRDIIFDPVPRVDGIDPSGDPLTEVRSDVYLQSGRRRRNELPGPGIRHAQVPSSEGWGP